MRKTSVFLWDATGGGGGVGGNECEGGESLTEANAKRPLACPLLSGSRVPSKR